MQRAGTGEQLFHVAPFAVDGELLGLGEWSLGDLSPRWLEVCRDLLNRHGKNFSTLLPAPLNDVALKFTSASGVALATFSQKDVPCVSSVLLYGYNPTAEQQLLIMFVQSARNLRFVQIVQHTSEPFAEVFSLVERPLHIAIAFGTGDKGEMIAEFDRHLAGAFLFPESSSSARSTGLSSIKE